MIATHTSGQYFSNTLMEFYFACCFATVGSVTARLEKPCVIVTR